MRERYVKDDEPLQAADDLWWSGLTPEEKESYDQRRYFLEAWNATVTDVQLQMIEDKKQQHSITEVDSTTEQLIAGRALMFLRK